MEILDLETLWYERERQELLRTYEAVHGKTAGRIIPHNLPRPMLSEVLQCARLAKLEPQIWAAAQKEAFFTDKQFEDREGILLHLIGPFLSWYRLKNELYDHDDYAFMRISPTLREWAHPDFDGDEVAALRRLLLPSSYIDDLLDDVSGRGSLA